MRGRRSSTVLVLLLVLAPVLAGCRSPSRPAPEAQAGAGTAGTTTPPEKAPAPPATRYVLASVANLRRAPQSDAPLLTKLRIGTPVTVHQVQGAWSEAESHGQRGFVLSELLSDTAPTVEMLTARFDATPADQPAERRKWAERATALDGRSVAAFERLVKALEASGADDAALARAREHLAGLNSRELVATAGGKYQLLARAGPGDLSQVVDLVQVEGRLFAATDGALLTRAADRNVWRAAWTADGKALGGFTDLEAGGGSWLWAASAYGLYRFDTVGLEFLRLGKEQGLLEDHVALVELGPSTVWIAYARESSIAEIGLDGRTVRHAELPDQDPSNRPVAFLLDGDSLYVACAQAVYRVSVPTMAVEQVVLPSWQPGHVDARWATTPEEIRLTAGPMAYRYDRAARAWTATPQEGPSRTAADLIWIGASYDVNAASYTALRYITDQSDDWKTAFYWELHALQARGGIQLGSALWIATSRGVLQWEVGSGSVVLHEASRTEKGALAVKPLRRKLRPGESGGSFLQLE
jgi:hypothetical protein